MALRVGRNNEKKKKSRIVIAIIRVKRTKINKNKYRKRKGSRLRTENNAGRTVPTPRRRDHLESEVRARTSTS